MPCCQTKRRVIDPKDLCSALHVHSLVRVEPNGGLSIIVPTGERMALSDALVKYGCSSNVPAVRLAHVVMLGVTKATEAGRTFGAPPGKSLPMIVLKDRLFSALGSCHTCKGSGCVQCKSLGFSP